jgi:hypothetical protein
LTRDLHDDRHRDRILLFRHVLYGAAAESTNTAVPFARLSNVLFDASPLTLTDVVNSRWTEFQLQIRSITRSLNGIDALLA